MIEKYLMDTKPCSLNGSVFGAFIDMVGVKVNEDILKLSVCNIVKEYIK